jgi:hypothetical protein
MTRARHDPAYLATRLCPTPPPYSPPKIQGISIMNEEHAITSDQAWLAIRILRHARAEAVKYGDFPAAVCKGQPIDIADVDAVIGALDNADRIVIKGEARP